MNITISTDNHLLDTETIFKLLEDSYWANKRPRALILKSLAHSLNFGVYNGTQMIGLARVVTDYATFGYLCDVTILEAYCGQGIGKQLMSAILEHPELQGIRRFMLATRDAHGLYAQFGFTPLAAPEKFMERYDPTV